MVRSTANRVVVKLFDWDLTGRDENLGRCALDIAQVVRAGRLDTWQTLQQAKHGKIHLRLSWHRLSTDVSDLNIALRETQVIRNAELSSAVLSVYIDSCKKLPNARAASKPDPYLQVTLGKKTETTGVVMRTDDPVYEIGYSFLVQNPEIDVLEIKAMDQKTNSALGMLTYPVGALLKQKDLSLLTQPLNLQRAGPETKIIISMQLKIVKEAIRESDIEQEEAPKTPTEPSPPPRPAAPKPAPSPAPSSDATDGAAAAVPSAPPAEVKSVQNGAPAAADDTSGESVPVEQLIRAEDATQDSELPSRSDSPKLVHRTSSITTSAGEAGLGRILISLRYSTQHQTLYVVVHKIMNIPLKDPTNVPDPYVKLYLLPGRSKDSKRKTAVIKDNCNPEYDEQFEYVIPLAELHSRQVEVSVATHKGFLGGSPVIGQVIVNLNQYDFREARTLWFDLLPETTRD